MSFSESHKDYTLDGLEDYAKRVIKINREQQEESSKASVCIAIAGGGGHAISTLAATPGASSILLEGTVTYDRRSYRTYVGISPTMAPSGFSYSSQEAATLASEAALKRALNFRANNLRLMAGCVGVGCASSLVSSSSPNDESVKGYGHVVATRADGTRLALNVSLAGKLGTEDRSRRDEDVFISYLVLKSIELIQQQQPENDIQKQKDKTETDAGDSISEEWETALRPNNDNINGEELDVAIAAANRILLDNEQAVVLLPMYKEGRPTTFRALKFPVIPNGSLIFPGSFNPPHEGHISLAQAAVRKAMDTGHSTRRNEKPIFFELSLTNVDKPSIDPNTVSERVHKFLELEDLPQQWGLILTRAPLFSEKVTSLKECIVDTTEGPVSKLAFVVGADTLVRIINPKYYNDDQGEMIEALRSMTGVNFFGGGRLEQSNKKGSSPDTNNSEAGEEEEPALFITGMQELEGLPDDVKNMFTIIEEKEFRVDISSTVLRNRSEEQVSNQQT